METQQTARPIYVIANEIRLHWKKVHFSAVPYLQAMNQMSSISDNYGADNGKSIIAYFLANAGSFRGEVAKRIKTELRKML